MAWRAIQDSVGQSESLAELSDLAERIYWRLLAMSDPWGRLDARPRKLRARCYPMLRCSDEQVGYALLEMLAVGRIVVYEKAGVTIVQIVDFERNQPRDAIRRRPDKSRFPDPSGRPESGDALIAALFSLRDPGSQESIPFAAVAGQSPLRRRRRRRRRVNL